jgi:hypothetical protein
MLSSRPHCEISRNVVCEFFTYLLALIEFWLAQGMPYSVEQMGKIYGQMINGATVTAVQTAETMGS